MEKKKNWLDTYLTPAKELVGYECYISCDYEKKIQKANFRLSSLRTEKL